MVSHNIEQIPKQQCKLFLVQRTLLRAVVDYESYKYKPITKTCLIVLRVLSQRNLLNGSLHQLQILQLYSLRWIFLRHLKTLRPEKHVE